MTPEERILHEEQTLRYSEEKRQEAKRLRLLRRAKTECLRISREVLEGCEETQVHEQIRTVQHYPDMEAALDMVWLTDFEASEEERIRKELGENGAELPSEHLSWVNGDGTLLAEPIMTPHLSSMIFEARLGQAKQRQERLKRTHPPSQIPLFGNSAVRVMEDTGATRNFISLETVQKRGLATFRTQDAKGLAVQLADKSVVRCTHMTQITLIFSPDYRYVTNCHILPMGTDVDVILGQPWIHSLGPHYKDPQKGIIRFRKSRSQQTIQLTTVVERHRNCQRAEVINAAMAVRDLRRGRQEGRTGYLAFYRISDQETVTLT
jgi:hypothetical protein